MAGGASYQARVAAVWLAHMLRGTVADGDAVVEVQVESRSAVDDVLVVFGSGRRRHVQAKRRLEAGTAPWKAFWKAAAADLEDRGVHVIQVTLAVGDADGRWDGLRTAIERARESRTAADFEASLRGSVKEAVDDVRAVFDEMENSRLRDLLRGVDLDSADPDMLLRRLTDAAPRTSITPENLASILADIAGEGGGVRRTFTAPTLRGILSEKYKIRFEPAQGGVGAYLDAVTALLNRVGIEGYLMQRADLAFVWPELRYPPEDRHIDVFTERDYGNSEIAEDSTTATRLCDRY